MSPGRGGPRRLLGPACALVLVVLLVGSTTALAGWTTGSIGNTANSAATGALAFTHTYPTGTCSSVVRSTGGACAGTLLPASVPTTGSASAADTITNTGTLGTARLEAEVRAQSCAPLQLANAKNAANPLLPRYGTVFNPTATSSDGPMGGAGYVTVDGASPGGYAAGVVAQAQPPTGLLDAGQVSGVGVWFRAAAGQSGPLFSFAASSTNGGGGNDRAVHLNSAGRIGITWNTAGSKLGPSSASYADGQWHFAYATFGGINVALLGLIPQVVLYVDGMEVATTPLISLSPLSSYAGYWHLGWARSAVTGVGVDHFTGSLSNFVVLNQSPPDGATLGKPVSQTAFNTAIAASVTEHWVLDDPGTSTYTGSLPGGAPSPCASVQVGWSTANPSGVVASGTTLSGLVASGWRVLPAPGPGTPQASTIQLQRAAAFHSYAEGLRLRVPLSYRVQSLPLGSSWTQQLDWAGAGSVLVR